MAGAKLYTIEDLLEMEDGCRHELIRGELISVPPTNDEHGLFNWRISGLLFMHYQQHPDFVCLAGDSGIVLARDPDLVLAPDLAIIRSDRLPAGFPQRSYSEIVPDLVIEILSPSERIGQISAKVDAYLEAGVQIIWLIDPARRNVTIHAPDQRTRILEHDDVLDGDDVLPEFHLPLADLFK